MGLKMNRRAALYAAAAVAVGLSFAPTAARADQWFDNSGADNNYTTATNWASTVPAENDNVPDAAGEIAVIRNGFTVNLSGTVSPNELQMSRGGSVDFPQTTTGTATLNVLPGANIQGLGSNGFRVGRAVQSGAAIGDSSAQILQTGGLLQINIGTNGLRLSQGDSGIVANSLYKISGGSARGGATDGAMTAPLQLGNIANDYGRAEFWVSGSGATEVRFEDIRLAGSLTASGGDAVLHFSIDAGGVTPMIAEDELQFRGNATTTGDNLLQIDLIGEAPTGDIVLVRADRISTNGGHAIETFTGMPEGTPIVRQFGGFEYTWTLDYTDSSSDDVLTDAVALRFVSRTVVPEPSAVALLTAGGLMLARRRRVRPAC